MMVVSVVNHGFRHRWKNLLQSVSSPPSFGMIRDVDTVKMLRKVTDADDGGLPPPLSGALRALVMEEEETDAAP